MTVLAIDAATEILSVALASQSQGGNTAVHAALNDAGLHHSRSLMTLVDRLLLDSGLKMSDIDLIACTRGPGSFTGLRIGMATAKGLGAAIAAHRELTTPPVVSVPTMDVLAYPLISDWSRVEDPGRQPVILPVIDGRKGRFYAAVFAAGRRATEDLDLRADEILLQAFERGDGAEILVTGPHAGSFVTSLNRPAPVLVDRLPRRNYSLSLLPLAISQFESHGADPQDQGPLYVRASDAELHRKTEHPGDAQSQ